MLREAKGFSQAEMLAQLGFKKSTWASYELNKANPGPEEMVRISDFFGVTLDEMIRRALSDGNLMAGHADRKNVQKGNLKGSPMGNLIGEKAENLPASEPLVAYGSPRYNVYDLDSRAAAGEALLLLESDKRPAEPNMYVPGLGFGVHIRLPISGDSMAPAIKDGDRAVGTWVPDLKELRSGTPVFLIDADDGIVCKRAYFHAKRRRLELVSINSTYRPYERDLEQVLAVFKIQEVHRRDFDTHGEDWRPVVEELRAEIGDLRRLLKR